jgi:hypothetical protein
MNRLLFKLNNVPEDEAQDIRDLLNTEGIQFYETDAGFWRVGLDAIWLADGSAEEKARELIRTYQENRTSQQQKNYAELVAQGQAPSLWQHFCVQPVRFIALLVAIVFVVGLTLIPFVILMF